MWVLCIASLCVVAGSLSKCEAAEGPAAAHCAVSTQPLPDWTSSFLTGNGNMGVIMSGDPYEEKLVVNGKLYLPLGSKEILPDLSDFKNEFKKAGLAAGKDGPATVHKLMLEKTDHKLINTDPFHPAFQLRIASQGDPDTVTNYRMTEDFATGELRVRWSDDQGNWSRRLFVSRPDDVVVMAIDGPQGKVNCELTMQVEHPQVKSELKLEEGWLGTHNTYLQGKGGYDNLIRVVPQGGRMSQHADRLAIDGADRVLLIMQVKPWKTPLPKQQSEAWAYSPNHPDLKLPHATNRLPGMKETLAGLQPDYEKLFVPHAQAHGSLYNRIQLDLGGDRELRNLTSEELLARAAKQGMMSNALAERLYNACRYLTICCSGDTPPNLQGIWTGTWNPAWSGDYTLDSNLQLEVQSMMSCNMPELMASYFDLVDSWIPEWRLNAKKIYGFRGVVSNARASNTCLLLHWGSQWPGEQAAIGLAGWMLHFYYDYYLFTGDRDFLAQRFVPLAKEIALFYEDFLSGTEDESGKYQFYMGYSPEHRLYANTTFDISIAKNVLTTLLTACQELGIEQQSQPKWQAMLDKMPPYLTNDAGELQEWSWPGVGEDYNQRHHSQFLPLYQFCEFDRDSTPELWKASELAFEQKVTHWLNGPKPNSNHITHGMMNQGQCAARLGRGDIVYDVLSRMVTRNYVYPSFMISYWPDLKGFGFDPIGTIPDVLNNSLVFACNDIVDVLPALPEQWPTGSISGVLLRGQIQVQQLTWDIPRGKVNLTLLSDKDQTVTLRFPERLRLLADPTSTPPNCQKLTLTKQKPVHIEITLSEQENP
ncbi:glycosyl hydrolase family 95 catalytic domain-containing protein [Novipirellula artificiosorum]|uniref:glycosyl hydrolase family 95 catalytic domain-containing protein n=1 Tax=Novipirellula artificiosorum TaxID=2528016 RepID=UPI0018CED362|nr:glycoside hydrolase N-terminal domain-containing protein [Novipirellula artificiosorum]